MESVPFEESAASAYTTPGEWSVDAPDTVRRMLERWELHSPVAYVGGISGAVFRVVQADGTPAVRKSHSRTSRDVSRRSDCRRFPRAAPP
jgi:hypothetical protein